MDTIYDVNVFLQWSHGMPEKTLADMLEIMKRGEISDYIRSGAEMPNKHTDADRRLQAEVSCIYTHM